MKMKKYIIVLLSVILCFIHTFSFADISSVRSEAGTRPASSPGGDGSTPSGGGDTESSDPYEGYEVIVDYVHSSISGNVLEDLKQNGATEEELRQAQNALGVNKAIVQLVNSNDQVIQTTYTYQKDGKDGYYEFKAGSGMNVTSASGNNKVRCIFGLVDNDDFLTEDEKNKLGLQGNETYSEDEIKRMLHYNGQDYSMQAIGQGLGEAKKIYTSYEVEITKKQKGCSQIFLLLDCSQSMQKIDEETGKTGLQIEQEAAKLLVDNLLSMDKNMYIGIIGFGEYTVVRKQLNNNAEVIKEAIDNLMLEVGSISQETGLVIDYGAGTNIAGAVELANESFANKDPDTSNRTIVLLSDGAPTIFGEEKIYADDSDATIIRKCNNIATWTNQTLHEIKDQGVKFMAIIPKTNDDFEDGLITKLFDGDIGLCYKPNSMDRIKEIVDREFTWEIQQSQTVATEVWCKGWEFEFFNDDNEDRRKSILSEYEHIDHENIQEFNILEQYDNGNWEAKERAKQFMAKNYMYAETDCVYEPLSGPEGGSTYVDEEAKKIYITIDEPYYNQHFILTQRELSGLELEMKMTGMRITLSDGTILEEKKIPITQDRDMGSNNQSVDSIVNLGNDFLYTIDTELIHGATLKIEYTIIVKNNSSLEYKDFQIVDYAPIGLTMNPDSKLITDDYTNKDYGWHNVDRNTLSNKIEQTKLDMMYDDVYPVASIDDTTEALRDISHMGSNAQRYVKVVFETVLNAGADDFNYTNDAEIYSYSNTESRRMGELISQDNGMGGKTYSTHYVYPSNGLEFDLCSAAPKVVGTLIIIPPTGVWHHYLHIAIILMIFVIAVISIQKYKEKQP